ncbi:MULTISPECIES: hypothetical protein [Streptomyces]|uniref:Uncharacterized protein n=1 Tax=Streptomyces cacaoi TaxID=1898 RepID=A0A4Y3QRZ8_STRCI|nr:MULTISPECIES: hypothetical protein [Streptomyces]GEB47709.1 hypothetical protein SCA03_02600 [Streptomyces cacaoi]
MRREAAILSGGPAAGLRVTVTGRPPVLQVAWPCEVEAADEQSPRVVALYVYRRTSFAPEEPLRYGFDAASP